MHTLHICERPLLSKTHNIKGCQSLKIFIITIIDCDTDIKLLKEQLKPTDDNQPYFFVLDLTGKVIEVVSGKYSEDKMDKLQEAID
jgi:hypothetical protein